MTASSNASQTRAPRCVPLGDVGDAPVGGKAEGLARLIAMGLPVPTGFVVLDARPGRLPDDLSERYREMGSGRVAVRSSAIGEDSAGASFAGQYETILNVRGEADVADAIERCLASLDSARADAYQHRVADAVHETAGEDDHRMCVVVQQMVDARAAGVLFTADPVTGRRAHVVIDSVRGLGEALVSGHASPDHYVMARDGRTLVAERAADAPDPDAPAPLVTPRATRGESVDEAERRALVDAALAAEARIGTELDLEWAIDAAGAIHWLQARPITTLGADPNELDSPCALDHVYTRCNVGEMFPGVCTPLSSSFTARGIDVGMQRMQRSVGIAGDVTLEPRFIAMFHGHLFLDLTTMAETPHALGSGPEQLALSICGRPIDEFEIRQPAPLPFGRRLANGLRYGRYLLGQRAARRRMRQLREVLAAVDVRESTESAGARSARAQWEAINARLTAIDDAMDYHLISSAGSGVLSTTLLAIVGERAAPTDADHARVAFLLAGADGVESADIAAGAERLQRAIAGHPDAPVRFANADVKDALGWLSTSDSGDAGRAFDAYLARHGHRAIKELELRQPEWRHDPTPLLKSLQAGVRNQLARGSSSPSPSPEPEPEPNRGPRDAAPGAALGLVTRMARQAVRAREETKSGLVDVTMQFKRAYRRLGDAGAKAGLLPDADAVFFLTHEELGRLVAGETQLASTAVARRAILPQQESLEFEDVFQGEAIPVAHAREELAAGVAAATAVTGAPVSRGRVVGRARVVLRLEDAEQLEPGEILIAKVTDVGWTPYFSVIAGLVTDVGSAVSHGAVVAREYGLPAVVNTRSATRVFSTGDLVILDGEQGIVQLADDEPAEPGPAR